MPPTVEARAAQTAPPPLPESAPLVEVMRHSPIVAGDKSRVLVDEPFTCSPEINQLVAGLAAAQLAFDSIERNQTATVTSRREGARSYTYDYADLAAVLHVVRPALAQQGIAVIQAPMVRQRVVTVITFIAHTSGQFLRNELACNIESLDPQTIGTAITYLRRYSLMALLGVAPEDDDDGAAASRQPVRSGQGPVQMPQRQAAPVPPAVGAAAGPASHSPAVVATAAAPAPPPVTIVALDGSRLSANRNRFWMVELSDGRKACTFSTTIGAALERGFANRTVYEDIVTQQKGQYLYVHELLPQTGGAQ